MSVSADLGYGLPNAWEQADRRLELLAACHDDASQRRATALGVGALARLGAQPGLTVAEALPDWKPAAVHEPRITPDEAAERRAGFRTEVAALLDRTPA